MSQEMWQNIVGLLQQELPLQQFNTWIRPLSHEKDGETLYIYAPNRFICDWVKEKYANRINEIVTDSNNQSLKLVFKISEEKETSIKLAVGSDRLNARESSIQKSVDFQHHTNRPSTLNKKYTFASFVEGKSNRVAKAAATQVVESPGNAYNPLFIYGASGLGKTHLMLAVGNEILKNNPNSKVLYIRSETFVMDYVKAIQNNTTDEFKRFYRTADVLLIDDIHFFAQKKQSQEELFHTFNALLEDERQIILTSDRYPKELEGVDERLKSRFAWGLTVEIEPPELETRVAILMKKAEEAKKQLPSEAAFFIAQKIRSHVRELESALNRVFATSQFSNSEITIELVKESLKDLLAIQDRLVTVDNIQKTVAEYYKIKLSDLTAKTRRRTIARPRQVAMSLSKELTNLSLPEIGDAFGGRDHTTVMHACKRIQELKLSDSDVLEDYNNLIRLLGS